MRRCLLPILLATAACSRFKTTDQLRDELRGVHADSSWLGFPCQELRVDEFGWRLDSLEGIPYRVHHSLIRRASPGHRMQLYESRNRRQSLLLQVDPSMASFFEFSRGLMQLKREECSIRDRGATVVTGRRDFNYATGVLWHDIGDGRSLRATARGRTLDEVQMLRATLFTMDFPGKG